MTLQIIMMALLYLTIMCMTFVMGYSIAMRKVLTHVQATTLEKTGRMLDEYKANKLETEADKAKAYQLSTQIDARMDVVNELHEALRPPFSKNK